MMDEALTRGILGGMKRESCSTEALTADRVEGAKVQSKGAWHGAALADVL